MAQKIKLYKKTITAVKHNELRNGKKCAAYWHLSSSGGKFETQISCEWYVKNIPKRILEVLESCKNNEVHPIYGLSNGLKKGKFEIHIDKKIEFNDFHCIDPKNVIEISKMEDLQYIVKYNKKGHYLI